MAKKQTFQIPFSNGHLVSYAGGGGGFTWKENYVFPDVLTFDSFERGRSAAHAVFFNEKGRRFPMFLTDLHDAMTHIVRGSLTGNFTFVKRGQNYGVKFVPKVEGNEEV